MKAPRWRPESFFIAQGLHSKPGLTLYSSAIYTTEAILHPDKWKGAEDDLVVRNGYPTGEKLQGAKGRNNVNTIFWPGIPLWGVFKPLNWPGFGPLTHECIAGWGIGWLLGIWSMSAVNLKTSCRIFRTLTVMMMMMVVSTEVALSKEDPVAWVIVV